MDSRERAWDTRVGTIELQILSSFTGCVIV